MSEVTSVLALSQPASDGAQLGAQLTICHGHRLSRSAMAPGRIGPSGKLLEQAFHHQPPTFRRRGIGRTDWC